MLTCSKCGAEFPDTAKYCLMCGRAVDYTPTRKKRGNGQGTVVRRGKKYRAVVTLGYYTDENGKRHRMTRSASFDKKKDAIEAIATLLKSQKQEKKKNVTFKELYDKWLPTHKATKKTIGCYTAAVKHFKSIWPMRMADIDIDDLQECIDECNCGRRTKENMRSLCSLMYKYGIPRKAVPDNLNLAQYLVVSGESATHRESFTSEQIAAIRAATGKVQHAEDILCMIYTGFRPSEFLALTAADYDEKNAALTGGAKTEAGKNRIVTVSPKIKPIVDSRVQRGGHLFGDEDGGAFSLRYFTDEIFYPALDEIGIDNPLVEIANGVKRHKYSPHTCRHTFATLLKEIKAPDKDKLELIGHASTEMLRYYQDVRQEDLRKITDKI